MNTVKQDDLAIIIQSGSLNDGLIVEVIGPFYPFNSVIEWNGEMWIIEEPRGAWHVQSKGGFLKNRGQSYEKGYIKTSALFPITGIPDSEETDEQSPLNIDCDVLTESVV